MSDSTNDPTGTRSVDASRRRTTRILIVAITTIAMIVLGAHVLSRRNSETPPAASATSVEPAVAADTASAVEASAAEAVAASNQETDAPEAQEDAEPEFAEADVRQEMCADYAKRYLKARTGVDLVRAVHLSQAAGCGWNSVLRADAATHDFVPGALKVAQEMEAQEVPTEGSSSAESIERIDRLADKLGDLDRKVDELRYRVR